MISDYIYESSSIYLSSSSNSSSSRQDRFYCAYFFLNSKNPYLLDLNYFSMVGLDLKGFSIEDLKGFSIEDLKGFSSVSKLLSD